MNKALDDAPAPLRSVFDSGAYHLREEELLLLHEVDFKLGALRIVILDGGRTPEEMKTARREEKLNGARQLEARRRD